MRISLAALLALSSPLLARPLAAQPPEPADPPSPPPAETPAPAAPGDAAPDLDFLEYLGSWQAKDDEWLAVKEWDESSGSEPGRGRKERPPERAGDDDE